MENFDGGMCNTNFFGYKYVKMQYFFVNKFLDTNIFLTKTFLDQKIFWAQNFFDPKCVRPKFLPIEIPTKNSGLKSFELKRFLPTDFGQQIFFNQRNI